MIFFHFHVKMSWMFETATYMLSKIFPFSLESLGFFFSVCLLSSTAQLQLTFIPSIFFCLGLSWHGCTEGALPLSSLCYSQRFSLPCESNSVCFEQSFSRAQGEITLPQPLDIVSSF